MARRFYKAVSVVSAPGGYGVRLDGRALKTPARRPLVVPGQALAAAIAEEWDCQGETLDPRTMRLTRLANTAIDRVAGERAPVIDEIARYGQSDLLCYRAVSPASLRARQDAGWQPLLDWAAEHLGAALRVADGVVPIEQDPAALARLRAEVAVLDALALTAFRELVGLSGSLVLALAVLHRHLEAEAGWELSEIDAVHQMERWGEDAEAAAARESHRRDFLAAARFLALLREESDGPGTK